MQRSRPEGCSLGRGIGRRTTIGTRRRRFRFDGTCLSIGERYDTRGFDTELNIGGSLRNTEDGGIDVIAGTIVRVAGDLTNDGGIRVGDQTGQTAGSSRLVITGNVVSTGALRLFKGGSLNVAGTLKVQSGSVLAMDGDPGFETFKMTAERIHLAAGTRFGARGTIFADLVDSGIFAPGASPGRVIANGSIALTSTAVTEIELAGTVAGQSYDQVVQIDPVGSDDDGAVIGGTLSLSLLGGYVPADYAVHRIFDVANRIGTFASVTGVKATRDRWLAVTYDRTV